MRPTTLRNLVFKSSKLFFMTSLALVFFIVPTVSHAASTFVWDNSVRDPDTSDILSGAPVLMEEGGTYPVPFNSVKDAWVLSDSPLAEFGAEGVLFFVPDPLAPNRTFIDNVGGFFGEQISWTQSGTYELDAYASPPLGLSQRTWREYLFDLFTTPVYAGVTDTFIETIRFTITDTTAPPPAVCCSSVVFLPGIKGSILSTGSDQLWPPSTFNVFDFSDDIMQLALDPITGESVNPVTVGGVLESFAVGPFATPIYSGFTSFLDGLVADGTIADWKPFSYDWRFSPDVIVENANMVARVEALANSSDTGQVTLVAHSMGGLVGKALIRALNVQGKAGLIDSFVMVGVPQLGTPQAAASLLHGDDENILGGLVVDATSVRLIGQNMPAAYGLLPSSRYFDTVNDPVIVFDPAASFTSEWSAYWGSAITKYLDFFSFATGGGVTRDNPPDSILRIPEVLNPTLMTDATNVHADLDNYIFPTGIRVVQVAGWGIPTVKAIKYTNKHFLQDYQTLITTEGDRTVVYPSAISSNAESYFVNLSLYNKNSEQNAQHRDILSASPVQEIIGKVINENIISGLSYVSETKPLLTETDTQLIISTHSPVILGARDSLDNFTGIDPSQNLSSAILHISEGIPGSTFLVSGDSEHLFLPKTGSYTITYQGTGVGPTTVEVAKMSNDVVTPIASYTDIPTTLQSSATFVVDSTVPANTIIEIDEDGDTIPDRIISPDLKDLTLQELITALKVKIQSLDVTQRLKNNLIKKVERIEKKIVKRKSDTVSKAVMNLGKRIIKKGERGKISNADVQEILNLLDQIQSAL